MNVKYKRVEYIFYAFKIMNKYPVARFYESLFYESYLRIERFL